MMIKVFWKQACPNCPAAKRLAKELEREGQKVEYCNLDEADGLAEAVFFDVMATPSIILVGDDGREVFSWRGRVPEKKELLEKLK